MRVMPVLQRRPEPCNPAPQVMAAPRHQAAAGASSPRPSSRRVTQGMRAGTAASEIRSQTKLRLRCTIHLWLSPPHSTGALNKARGSPNFLPQPGQPQHGQARPTASRCESLCNLSCKTSPGITVLACELGGAFSGGCACCNGPVLPSQRASRPDGAHTSRLRMASHPSTTTYTYA